ncbi:MAG: hypothetical protein JW395_3663 [Nitrospira sp.]|nr:hypothetical protein [Nitrospira sp.]
MLLLVLSSASRSYSSLCLFWGQFLHPKSNSCEGSRERIRRQCPLSDCVLYRLSVPDLPCSPDCSDGCGDCEEPTSCDHPHRTREEPHDLRHEGRAAEDPERPRKISDSEDQLPKENQKWSDRCKESQYGDPEQLNRSREIPKYLHDKLQSRNERVSEEFQEALNNREKCFRQLDRNPFEGDNNLLPHELHILGSGCESLICLTSCLTHPLNFFCVGPSLFTSHRQEVLECLQSAKHLEQPTVVIFERVFQMHESSLKTILTDFLLDSCVGQTNRLQGSFTAWGFTRHSRHD